MAMNSNSSAWSQSESFAALGEQDFGNLVDFDLNHFDFLSYDPNQDGAPKLPDNINLDLLASSAGQQHGLQQTHLAGGANGNMFDMAIPISFEGQQQNHNHAFSMPQSPESMLQHSMIPPTPNSVEMHGDHNRYLQQMDAQSRAILLQQYQMQQQRKDAVSSPAFRTLLHHPANLRR
jgi:hypothetical protein